MASRTQSLALLSLSSLLAMTFSSFALAAEPEVTAVDASETEEVAEDTTEPSDVENILAIPGDGEVTLTWDPATDDTAVTGYIVYSGLTSVIVDEGEYTFGATNVGNVVSYTMENLSNEVTYYFSVTAFDANENESLHYSTEVEATPAEGETGDFTSPTVSDANAVSSTLVEVEFSENVVLPSDAGSAFSIVATDGTAIEVLDAYTIGDGGTVMLVTDVQTAGAQYILTGGIQIADAAGNPIVSGTTDTASFTGSALEGMDVDDGTDDGTDEGTDDGTDDVSTPTEGFAIEGVTALTADSVEIDFSEDLALAEASSFTIQLMDDALIEVLVLDAVISGNDASVVTLITESMEAGNEYIITMDTAVLNASGASLEAAARSVDFTAKTMDLSDLIPPEDVTAFLADALNETTVALSWDASVNSAGDLAHYLLYSAVSDADFGEAVMLAMDVLEYEMDGLTPGETYNFKVTAVDENGNESEGVMSTVTLPETGPGMIAFAGISLLGAGVVTRRRK
jgi:hypothetical protein